MAFESWCVLQASEVRQRLRVLMLELHRRRIAREHGSSYWLREHQAEQHMHLTRPRLR